MMRQGISRIFWTRVGFIVLGVMCAASLSAQLLEDERNTIDIVRRTKKSVVFITNIQLVQDYFGFSSEEVPRGTGSGFVWDNRGHIVTNFHVIEDGVRFLVRCPDSEEERQAELVGKDPAKDIAVLRIRGNTGDLNPLKIGISRDLQVGQKVIAIGNPFGFDHTVTTGIVSALDRQILGAGNVTIRDMIQTDASINPGNSGGPLLDSQGLLIGMNTVIASRTGQSSGVGFAVPVDTINKIVPQIIRFGHVIRPGLGVNFVSDTIARRNRVEGLIILEVKDRSATRAGLRGLSRNRRGQYVIEDVLVGINDIPVKNYDDLYNALEDFEIGDTVTLKVRRNGKVRSVSFKLIQLR